MITLLLLASAISGDRPETSPVICPTATNSASSLALSKRLSKIESHRALRRSMGEPMPTAATMVMLYGYGGHLATSEYSIVLARGTDGVWRGTAVGRTRIWVQDAPYTPMSRVEWALDPAAGKQLNDSVDRHCPRVDRPYSPSKKPSPPPLGTIFEVLDVVTGDHQHAVSVAPYRSDDLATMVRPPAGTNP